jgi:hypothetical protein
LRLVVVRLGGIRSFVVLVLRLASVVVDFGVIIDLRILDRMGLRCIGMVVQ